MQCTECGNDVDSLTALSKKIDVCDQCRMQIEQALAKQNIIEKYAELTR